MNKFLSEQIIKYLGDPENISSELVPFLNVVNMSYNHFEKSEAAYSRNIQELKKINTELDQFTYVVSHDLKAPLRAISSLTVFLEEDLQHSLNNETKANFAILKNRVNRMENFINGLLEYSRVAKSTNSRVIETKKLIEEIIQSLSCPDNINIKIIDGLPLLKGDQIKLEQVFSNLISNAIKYNNKETGLIEIGCDEGDEWTEFYVKDNGRGIDQQYHEKIFALFYTLESKDTIEGTGIGLAIVKKIVEEFGGSIRVESEPGIGSTFVFTYPKLKSDVLITKY